VIFKIKRPYWNHDGGTICLGPDGLSLCRARDGGSADDPRKVGQKLNSVLGKVLRIDVDRKDEGFGLRHSQRQSFRKAKRTHAVKSWAYGLRNVWRMSFDRKTGKLWASTSARTFYEEIDIISKKAASTAGACAKGLHPFQHQRRRCQQQDDRPDLGIPSQRRQVAHRRPRLSRQARSELDGYYLYGDYLTTKIWALKYDEGKTASFANRPIQDPNLPILSFGEDEFGEIYFLTTTLSGDGIRRFVPTANAENTVAKLFRRRHEIAGCRRRTRWWSGSRSPNSSSPKERIGRFGSWIGRLATTRFLLRHT